MKNYKLSESPILNVQIILNYDFQVLRLTHGLLSRLMAVFPIESSSSSSVASKHDELDFLYVCVGKVSTNNNFIISVYECYLSVSRMLVNKL